MRSLLAFLVMGFASAATAAPVTYACTLLEGANELGMYSDVDQVIVDVAAKNIEFRVARTMGTLVPVNWIFADRDGDDPHEQFIIRDNGNGVITAAGMNGVGSYSINLNGQYLLFGVTMVGSTVAFTWECRR